MTFGKSCLSKPSYCVGCSAVSVPKPGDVFDEAMRVLGSFLRDVMKLNEQQRNFRVFGPDETASNRLSALFEVTDPAWAAPTIPEDESLAPDGRVMEILSEHTCQGWLEGYLLTGRHGFFSCYEAFIHIIDSMFNQHAKWLKVTREIACWRPMKLQPQSEHPHGLSDKEFDALFTTDKPIIFAFHGYPWLIHRVTYRRTNHKNLHVRGYKEEGTTTTPFDMAVMNDLDRLGLVTDVIDRVPKLGASVGYVTQYMRDKRIEHKEYISKFGEDMPKVRDWKWPHA